MPLNKKAVARITRRYDTEIARLAAKHTKATETVREIEGEIAVIQAAKDAALAAGRTQAETEAPAFAFPTPHSEAA